MLFRPPHALSRGMLSNRPFQLDFFARVGAGVLEKVQEALLVHDHLHLLLGCAVAVTNDGNYTPQPFLVGVRGRHRLRAERGRGCLCTCMLIHPAAWPAPSGVGAPWRTARCWSRRRRGRRPRRVHSASAVAASVCGAIIPTPTQSDTPTTPRIDLQLADSRRGAALFFFLLGRKDA